MTRYSLIVGLCLIAPAVAAAQVADCDALAASNLDDTRPRDVPGVSYDKVDPPRAIAACRKALDERPNDARMKFQLARAIQKSGQDLAEAVRLNREAADGGAVVAMNNLATMLKDGQGAQRDERAAAAWYRRAAESGLPMSMTLLGSLYKSGQGVDKDPAEAVRWYRKAADRGYGEAMRYLAEGLHTGVGVARNEGEATRWFLRAAEAGDRSAMSSYGLALEEGRGVPKNAGEANAWYRKAAEAGDWEGMRFLANNLHRGKVIARNDVESTKWFRKAAEAGSTLAMAEYALALEEGRGVTQNLAQANSFYRKSASSGHLLAKLGLSRLVEYHDEFREGSGENENLSRDVLNALRSDEYRDVILAQYGITYKDVLRLSRQHFRLGQILQAAIDRDILEPDGASRFPVHERQKQLDHAADVRRRDPDRMNMLTARARQDRALTKEYDDLLIDAQRAESEGRTADAKAARARIEAIDQQRRDAINANSSR